MKDKKDEKDLQSFFLHRNKPYLTLGPFRIEEKNKSPYIAVFHQFFHERETNVFIQYASETLERSETFISKGNLGTSMSRTTKQTYVPEDTKELPEAGSVSDRIKLATNFRARFWPKEESEEWQVNFIRKCRYNRYF